MKVSVGSVVVPGDVADNIRAPSDKMKVVLGPGLRRLDDTIHICKAGVLRKKEPNTFWVESYQKRYIPARGECLIGVVVQQAGDVFRVDIGASSTAALSYLSFEGATKKNRPDVNIGDVIFAKLSIASKDMEPELVCVDSHGKKGRFGVINDGFVFKCSLHLVTKILNQKCPLIDTLQKEFPFEIAAGMNGRIWIKAKSCRETIAVGNAILASEFLNHDEVNKLCKNVALLLARS